MILCKEAKYRLSEFIADSLSEEMRAKMRDHLDHCDSCRSFRMSLDCFSTDLKRLGEVTLPFDLAQEISSRLVCKEASSEKITSRIKGFFMGLSAIGLVSALLFVIVRATPGKNPPTKYLSEAEKMFAETQLEQLEKIEASLKRSERGSGAAGMSAIRPPRVVERLHPFHWHMHCESASACAALRQKITEIKIEEIFNLKDSLLVLSLEQEKLGPLVELLKNFKGASVIGNLVDPTTLPQSQAPLRVSISFVPLNEADESAASGALHWHLQFLLGNARSMREYLRDQKINFLYDSSELWAVEMTAAEFDALRTAIKGVPGLVIDYGKSEVTPRPEASGRIRLVLLMKE